MATKDKIIDYLIDAAYLMGINTSKLKNNSTLRNEDYQKAYSVAWYFERFLKRDLNNSPDDYSEQETDNLLAAYLGFGKLKEPNAYLLQEKIDSYLSHGFTGLNELNDEQNQAIHNAFKNKLSIIKGPPGTGKTEVITRIIAIAVDIGWKVALVSANNKAVDNVAEKLQDAFNDETDNLLRHTATKMARLGSSNKRKEFKPLGNGKEFNFETGKKNKGFEKTITFSDFTGEYPFVISTIHSLKKCFKDGADPDSKYDLLIMDEASQCNTVLGILALSSARNAVIVGDDQQLSPITETFQMQCYKGLFEKHVPAEHHSHAKPYNLARKDFSFLDSCYEVFSCASSNKADSDTKSASSTDSDLSVTLKQHFRCPPKIIGFCNDAIYDGILEPQRSPDEKAEFPLALRWYQGDYRERKWEKIHTDSDGNRTCGKSGVINARQLEIFRWEEIPYIKKRLEAEPKPSVCILTPFRSQAAELKKILLEELDVHDTKSSTTNSDGIHESKLALGKEDTNDKTSSDSFIPFEDQPYKLNALTIHKSQGRGFDIVYLLPVEDGSWEWPWSQGKRLINVAVSRAKQELHVIASTKLMCPCMQRSLTNRPVLQEHQTNKKNDPTDEQLFVQKLACYIYSNSVPEMAPFGVRESQLRSIFDEVPYVQKEHLSTSRQSKENDSETSTPKESKISAPEEIVRKQLEKICAENNLELETEVELSRITMTKSSNDSEQEDDWDKILFKSKDNVGDLRFDFVIKKKSGEVIMAIEVDGAYHRFLSDGHQKLEEDKNSSLKAVMKAEKIEINASVATSKEHIVNLGKVISDFRKEIVTIKCWGGHVAHLGKDSFFSYQKDFLEKVYEQEYGQISELKQSSSPIKELLTEPNNYLSNPQNIKGFTLLRIPCDGTTFLETDELLEQAQNAQTTLDKQSLKERPTINKYIIACLEASKDSSTNWLHLILLPKRE